MKQITRKAEAEWKGNLKSGNGQVTTESKSMVGQPYSFSKRTSPEDKSETNPEELIAAAAASCFAMALSKTLQDRDTTAEQLAVTAEVTLAIRDTGPEIATMALAISGTVDGFSEEQLRDAVDATCKSCPVYLLLNEGLEKTDVSVSINN